MFAATPPLEAKKALFSLAMSKISAGCGTQGCEAMKLVFIDVRRAYFDAAASRNIYIQLPPEDAKPGYVGKLNKAMYGTRDAAANWERRYCEHLQNVGFINA